MHSEQLKPEEFDAHIANGTFRLAFVGMSANAARPGLAAAMRRAQSKNPSLAYRTCAHRLADEHMSVPHRGDQELPKRL